MDFPSFIALALLSLLVMSAVMAIAFLAQRRTDNSGWIDVFWALGTGVTSAMMVLGFPHVPGYRPMLVLMLVLTWSSRLGVHIATRTRRIADDPRYRALIESWGADAPWLLFWQLQAQAAVGGILALSVELAAANPAAGNRAGDIIGVTLFVAGIAGESVADAQLTRFRQSDAKAHRVCDTGLWRYSRHPNYFFEWLCWCAYPVIALDTMGGSLFAPVACAAPVLMYWALVHVSGIPPLEEHMLKTRGDAYRMYQQRTPPFFPWRWITPSTAKRGNTPRDL